MNVFPGARLRPLPSPFADRLADDHVATKTGAVWLYDLAPGVVYTQGAGHWDLPCANRLIAFCEPHFVARRNVILVHDWADIASYDVEVRLALTKWAIKNRAYLKNIHLLLESAIAQMGVSIANVATSAAGVHMHSYRERAEFDQRLAEILQRGAARR